ncbi:uncharacterized protein LOC62_02G002894 [Vanrija pseudolonga]|uniref:Uncharacterized protein n=1 Tax=Vanrija pseudolonga TaxID=143232 RepID=A0AAF0Y372_9TREE|nr:hypothetical protein LOC62_02G002894 [Vanrija pseudolonga]
MPLQARESAPALPSKWRSGPPTARGVLGAIAGSVLLGLSISWGIQTAVETGLNIYYPPHSGGKAASIALCVAWFLCAVPAVYALIHAQKRWGCVPTALVASLLLPLGVAVWNVAMRYAGKTSIEAWCIHKNPTYDATACSADWRRGTVVQWCGSVVACVAAAGVAAYFVSSGRATTDPQPWVAMNAQRTAAALGRQGQGEAMAAA